MLRVLRAGWEKGEASRGLRERKIEMRLEKRRLMENANSSHPQGRSHLSHQRSVSVCLGCVWVVAVLFKDS